MKNFVVRKYFYRTLFCLIFILFCPPLKAENTLKTDKLLREISQDNLENKIENLNARTDLENSTKNKLLVLYRNIEDNLHSEEWFKFLATSYQESINQADSQIKSKQEKINALQTAYAQQKTESLAGLSIDVLEKRLVIEKSHLNDTDVQLVSLNTELTKQENRPQEIRQETEIANQALMQANKSIENWGGVADNELEREARELQLKTLINKLTSELKSLGLEAISYPARLQLLKLDLQLATLEKQILLPVINDIEKTLATKRQLEALKIRQQLLQTEKDSLDKHVLIQEATRNNLNYSRELQSVTEKLEQNTLIKEQLEARILSVENDFKNAERKINLAGLNPTLGKILREQRRNLANSSLFPKLSLDIENETAQTSLAGFKVEDNLKQLTDIETLLAELMRERVNNKIPLKQRQVIEHELRSLLIDQKQLLDKLSQVYALYLHSLSDYVFAKQQLTKQVDKYALYLDERLLWMASSAPINSHYLLGLYDSSLWLLHWAHWQQLFNDLVWVIFDYAFLSMMISLCVTGLLFYRKTIIKNIAELNERVSHFYTDDFRFTLQALAETLLIVCPIPLVLFYLGWCLDSETNLNGFSVAIGKSSRAAAIPLLFLQFFYQLFKANGIIKKHFNWQQMNVDVLRRHLGWIRFVAVPAIFLITLTATADAGLHSDTLGRAALVISLLALAWVLAQVFDLKTGLLHQILETQPNSLVARLRYLAYVGVVLPPLIVVGFAVAGYYVSALELQQKLIITLRLVFVMVVIHQLVLRWLTLVDRQLALKNAQQKRKASADEIGNLDIGELLLDIPKINQQTIKVLEATIALISLTGFWMIWKNILPAFSFFDEVVLWRYSQVTNNQETFQAITLTNLLLAGLYTFVMFVSVINFPGVMEVVLLRRLSIEAGSRYAINQLARYVLIAIGFVSIANELGGSWSQVQWLVAALTVGLGFGLQEIFANLVSGIILLFERPIRVGDTVTVSDVDGKISKIQMRATHIVDCDQKELIIPNKTFITGKVMNWTLSSQMTRLVIPLGIAYGSDITLAYQVIYQTVCDTPKVLAEPKPKVYFIGFGDSSLEFSIRVHVNELEDRLPVTHELHTRLYHALVAHHISIPFPQRELHIRSAQPEV